MIFYGSSAARGTFIRKNELFPLTLVSFVRFFNGSYYVESCGHISEDAVKKYLEDQKRN